MCLVAQQAWRIPCLIRSEEITPFTDRPTDRSRHRAWGFTVILTLQTRRRVLLALLRRHFVRPLQRHHPVSSTHGGLLQDVPAAAAATASAGDNDRPGPP
ncbi:hypothetical protein SEVIR_5G426700v4 [Setaria viridis]|uniref:Uncharacterized protein n=1 Tax=Setaria viridis TaxID=4556 RepID=A0A4U6URP2_SETVI|nr:hypothetical protein SEVIR_5G426700v2 [Setaria viridis]